MVQFFMPHSVHTVLKFQVYRACFHTREESANSLVEMWNRTKKEIIEHRQSVCVYYTMQT